MEAVESLVEVVLVFGRGGRCDVTPYGDGFLLVTQRDGTNGFRHWQLDGGVGEITTSGDNEVTTVRVRRAAGAAVELPDPALLDESEGEARARMAWPAPAAASVEALGETTRHELRLDTRPPALWMRLGRSAWVGTTADGALARVVVEASRMATARLAVRIPAGPFTATRQAGFVQVSWAGTGRRIDRRESLRGNAALTLDSEGVATALEVHDLEEGAPLRPTAGEPAGPLWLDWPCDVTAARWDEGDGTAMGVRFGPAEPERWFVLESGVAVGASMDGELRRLVVPRVDADPRVQRGMFRAAGMSGHDPFAALTDLAESGAGGLTVYGLAGEEGRIGGHSGLSAAPDSVGLVFGEPEAGHFVEVTSTSTADEWALRHQAAAELAMLDRPDDLGDAFFEELRALEDELTAAPLETVPIRVDGRAVDLGVLRHGSGWAGVAAVGEQGLYLVGAGRGPEELDLEPVRDLRPAAERLRKRHGIPERLPVAAPDEDLLAAGAVVDGLLASLQLIAGAPPLGGLFTDAVTETRGGADRYGRLLALHVMLRPISGWSSSAEALQHRDDGAVDVALAVNHAAPNDGGWTRFGPSDENAPEPDRAAIRAGASHVIELRLVREDGAWKLDTDLLALLEQQLGTVDELVGPLSEQ